MVITQRLAAYEAVAFHHRPGRRHDRAERHEQIVERIARVAVGYRQQILPAHPVFVHAGLNPKKSIAENLNPIDPQVALWTRSHLKAKLKKWEKPVVCGHTPQREPINDPKLINIDTGAVYSHIEGLGVLTAVKLPEREFTQVEFEG